MSSVNNISGSYRSGPISVAVVMTGGTIAKSYDPSTAQLHNFEPKVKELLANLRADDVTFSFNDVLQLDSLEVGDVERQIIIDAVKSSCLNHNAVIVTHGTDSLTDTAEQLYSEYQPNVPVIFTGAMVPYSVKKSDAFQNVTEALLAARILPAGVFVVFHNRILSLPGVGKDHDLLTFSEYAK